MEQLSILKKALENTCSIIVWNPTSSQLQQIAKQLAESNANEIGEVAGIVSRICPNTKFLSLEGIDNSDLRTLIALAIQVANAKG